MEMRALDLVPVAEFQLTTDTIRKFRTGYVAAFGAADPEDMLYEAVSEGRRHPGMEHWLPLFHDKLDTLFDYVPGAPVILENLVEDAARERLAQIKDYYEARKEALAEHSGTLYKPLPPDRLYLPEAEWAERLNTAALARLTPFAVPEEGGASVDVGARAGHNFSAERAENAAGVFDAVSKHVQALQAAGKRVVIALWSEGARERMKHVLAEHGLHNLSPVASWLEALALPKPQVALAVLGLEGGFETADVAVISEQDILGDRLVRPRRASKRSDNFIAEVTSLSDRRSRRACRSRHRPLHRVAEHRGGRRAARLPGNPLRRGRQALSAGREHRAAVALRLGGHRRRARPARRHRLADPQGAAEEPHPRDRPRADQDRGRAASCARRRSSSMATGASDEFAAGFPYEETDDQQTAIDATLDDLATGRPMDRLICGDVGFGKTEVALRAAFATVMGGKQVAVVVPTTLLARQHTKTFTERFKGFPVKVGQASRLVSSAELTRVKKGIADGADRHRRRHPRAARQGDQVQGPRPRRSSTRSSTSASRTRSGSRRCAPRCMC